MWGAVRGLDKPINRSSTTFIYRCRSDKNLLKKGVCHSVCQICVIKKGVKREKEELLDTPKKLSLVQQ